MKQIERKLLKNLLLKDFLVLIFLYNIQGVLIISICFKFFDYYQTIFADIIFIGLIFGIIIWLVKGMSFYLNFEYGIHYIILVVILFILLSTLGEMKISIALGSSLFSFSLVLIGNTLKEYIKEKFTRRNNAILDRPWIHILIGQIENVILLLFLFYI